MIYLIIHIILIALFSSCYKYTAEKKADAPSTQLLMYITGASFAFVGILSLGGFGCPSRVIVLGLTASGLLVITMRTFFMAMKQGGLAVGWVIISLAVVFPVIASIFVWKEIPTAYQIIGFVLLIPCILLFGNLDLQVEGNRKRWALLVGIAFATTGILWIIAKAVATLPAAELLTLPEKARINFHYLLLTYGLGAVMFSLLRIRKGFRIRKLEVKIGVMMGVLNITAIIALLAALSKVEGIILFPIKGGASVLLTALIAVFFFKEKLTRRQMVGIAFGILCVILVNIK